jgi:hypothetical protein
MIQAVIAGAVSTVLADWARSFAVPLVRRRLARPTRNGTPARSRIGPAPVPGPRVPRTEAYIRTLER